jgi:hemerythrin superfamily protein
LSRPAQRGPFRFTIYEDRMSDKIAFEDAVDLLDADHKAVKSLFIEFNALSDDQAPAADRQAVALKICQALTVHAQLEEELFYPAVRQAIGDDALMDEAILEHAEAKEMIARIQEMDAQDEAFDDTVKELGIDIDHHVLEEREQIFLKAKLADLDLRGMVPALAKRKEQLQKKAAMPARAAA